MNKLIPPVISGAFYACLPMLCSCFLFAIAACEGNAAMPDERKPNVAVVTATFKYE